LQVLQQKLRESKKEYKQLFVVHNYMEAKTEIELFELWQKYVISTQNGTIKSQSFSGVEDQAVFLQETTGESTIIHTFLGCHKSPAGEKWNNRTFRLLNQFISSRIVFPKAPFVELLLTTTLETLRVYCKAPAKVDVVPNKIAPGKVDGKRQIVPNSNGEINFEEWLGCTAVFVPPQETKHLLQIGGDLSLKADKVDFDGFRILLTRNTEEFAPKYDILELKNGLEVVVDLPQLGVKEVKTKISYEVGKSVLSISGKRELFFYDWSGSSGPIKVPYSPDNCKIIPSLELKRARQQSEFQFDIVLPQTVSDVIKYAKKHTESGVFAIYLENKDVSEEDE